MSSFFSSHDWSGIRHTLQHENEQLFQVCSDKPRLLHALLVGGASVGNRGWKAETLSSLPDLLHLKKTAGAEGLGIRLYIPSMPAADRQKYACIEGVFVP